MPLIKTPHIFGDEKFNERGLVRLRSTNIYVEQNNLLFLKGLENLSRLICSQTISAYKRHKDKLAGEYASTYQKMLGDGRMDHPGDQLSSFQRCLQSRTYGTPFEYKPAIKPNWEESQAWERPDVCILYPTDYENLCLSLSWQMIPVEVDTDSGIFTETGQRGMNGGFIFHRDKSVEHLTGRWSSHS